MTEQQLNIIKLVTNHKQYNTLKKELAKSSYEPISIVPKDYIQVFNNSLLNIAKLFGKRIEYTVDDMTMYDCVVDIDGVTFTALYSCDDDEEADMIDEIIEYIEDYDDYFSLQQGEFIPSLVSKKGFLVVYSGSSKNLTATLFEGTTLISEYKHKNFYDFCDEVVAQNNKCACTINSLIDTAGGKWLIWGDSETREAFITLIPDIIEGV